MVNSGTVNNDASSISSAFSKFDSAVGETASVWKGLSHDMFDSLAHNFSSDFSSSLNGQMNSFATACDLYSQYSTTKSNYKTAQSNYNTAIAAGEDSDANKFSSQMNSYREEMRTLKGQIESALNSVKNVKLEASPLNPSINASGKISQNSSSSSAVQSAIDWAIGIANDNSYGYSQKTRWGNPNYDCSSLLIAAYEAAGVPVKTNGATYTGNMREVFTKTGFKCYEYGSVDLQPGDVLLRSDHTEMYVGDGKNVGAHTNRDGRDGDSSGTEINVSKNGGNWKWVLRYEG